MGAILRCERAQFQKGKERFMHGFGGSADTRRRQKLCSGLIYTATKRATLKGATHRFVRRKDERGGGRMRAQLTLHCSRESDVSSQDRILTLSCRKYWSHS